MIQVITMYFIFVFLFAACFSDGSAKRFCNLNPETRIGYLSYWTFSPIIKPACWLSEVRSKK